LLRIARKVDGGSRIEMLYFTFDGAKIRQKMYKGKGKTINRRMIFPKTIGDFLKIRNLGNDSY